MSCVTHVYFLKSYMIIFFIRIVQNIKNMMELRINNSGKDMWNPIEVILQYQLSFISGFWDLLKWKKICKYFILWAYINMKGIWRAPRPAKLGFSRIRTSHLWLLFTIWYYNSQQYDHTRFRCSLCHNIVSRLDRESNYHIPFK